MSSFTSFALNVPWVYTPGQRGPVIATNGSSCNVTRDANSGTDNVWSYLTYPVNMVTTGWTVGFDIKYDTINPVTEVKLSLLKNLHLRYDRGVFAYQYYGPVGQFVTICPSGISVGQSGFTRVSLLMLSDGIQISENGTVKGKWSTDTSSLAKITFDWQIFSGASQLKAQVQNVFAQPPSPS